MTSPLTVAQRSNFLTPTACLYPVWRGYSLTLLTAQSFPLSREARLFLHLAQPQTQEHWLDMGTSTGFYAGLLAQSGCRVDAADLSPAMLREAARRQTSPLITWKRLNAENSGLTAGTYDGVTIGATLNETASPSQLLQEAARLLKPGGKLWLMYVAASSSLGQTLLARVGGLTFPELAWIEWKLPDFHLRYAARFGLVEFALLVKETP